MAEQPPDQVTQLLDDLSKGREEAAEQLLPLIYEQLRKLAQVRMNDERPGHTLQATALVHEAYMKLIGDQDPGWSHRGHFYVAAAQAMRQILIDHARGKGRVKRGAGAKRQPLTAVDLAHVADLDLILDLDDAIERLKESDPEAARIVHLRFYAGLSVEETADTLGVSRSTIKREWDFARDWLFDHMSGNEEC